MEVTKPDYLMPVTQLFANPEIRSRLRLMQLPGWPEVFPEKQCHPWLLAGLPI
jgi:hypothetical protein